MRIKDSLHENELPNSNYLALKRNWFFFLIFEVSFVAQYLPGHKIHKKSGEISKKTTIDLDFSYWPSFFIGCSNAIRV